MFSHPYSWFRGAVFVVALLGAVTVGSAQTEKDREDYRAATKLFDGDDFAGAEAGFGALIERLPDLAVARYARAMARLRQEKDQAAIDDLDVALSLNPQMAEAYQVRAEARAQLSNYAGAVADADTAVRLTKNAEWRTLLTRARIQHAFGHLPEAVADFTAVLALDADNADARFARADIQVDLGNAEEAKADLRRLLENYHDKPEIHLRLAAAEFALLHWSDASLNLDKAIELGTPPADTARLRGLILFAQGDFAGAAAKLREALAAEPKRNAYPHLMLHLAQRRSGKPAPDLKPAIDGMESQWAKLIAYFLLGDGTDSELLETAQGKTDPKLKRGHTCEAYYYIGQSRLLAGDRIAAKAFFQQAVATGAKEYDEYTLAQGELAR